MKRFGVSRGVGLALAALWLALLIGGIALRQAVDWQVTRLHRSRLNPHTVRLSAACDCLLMLCCQGYLLCFRLWWYLMHFRC